MDFNPISVLDFPQVDILEELISTDFQREKLQEQSVHSDGFLDYLQHNVAFPPLVTCLEESAEHQRANADLQELVGREQSSVSFSASRLEDHEQQLRGNPDPSTMDIFRATTKKHAGASSDATVNNFCYHGDSEEVWHKLRLVELLMAAAKNVICQMFDEVHPLLDHCDRCSSNSGNPIERIVFHFSNALRESIHQDDATSSTWILGNHFMKWLTADLQEAVTSYSPILAIHKKLPFCQVWQFCTVQIIEEHVVTTRRIHIIDLDIRSGVHWSTLMQGFIGRHEYPVKHLRIPAVGTLANEFLDEIGQRLQLFAQKLNLSFSFRVIMLSGAKVLREDFFDVEEDECVIISALFALRTWIPCLDKFQSLMMEIKRANPTIMVVADSEATFASPDLINRLAEALLYFGDFIDRLEDCLGRNNHDRPIVANLFLMKEINNVIMGGGKEAMAIPDLKANDGEHSSVAWG